jgi:hypothetical protein
MKGSPHAMTEAETLAILTHACATADLSADAARLLRLGSNAVYRLAVRSYEDYPAQMRAPGLPSGLWPSPDGSETASS